MDLKARLDIGHEAAANKGEVTGSVFEKVVLSLKRLGNLEKH